MNSDLIGGLKYDLTQCSDNLVVAYFFGPPCIGVPKIFQWREFTGVDPGIFQKGAEPGPYGGSPGTKPGMGVRVTNSPQ